MKRSLLVAGFLACIPGFILPAHGQDPEAGKIVFKSICNLCHEAIEGKNRVGPSLYGVVGRRAGGMPDFTYSPVLKGSGITWNEEMLDKWIGGPQSVVPGTRMTYGGLKDDKKRHDVIAYLKTLRH